MRFIPQPISSEGVFSHVVIKVNFNSIAEVAESKQCNELGRFQCKGYDTFGPFKLVGGIQKGHPTDDEIVEVVEFYKNL